MDLRLKGKTAVVSGSTSGIGLPVATALASGERLWWLMGRNEARVAAAVTQIREKANDAQVRGVAADLGMASGIETFLKHVPEADVLVNNLGIFEVKPFLEIRRRLAAVVRSECAERSAPDTLLPARHAKKELGPGDRKVGAVNRWRTLLFQDQLTYAANDILSI